MMVWITTEATFEVESQQRDRVEQDCDIWWCRQRICADSDSTSNPESHHPYAKDAIILGALKWVTWGLFAADSRVFWIWSGNAVLSSDTPYSY